MQKTRPQAAAAPISEVEWSFLHDEIADGVNSPALWSLRFNNGIFTPSRKAASELWSEYGETILAWWAQQRPGTRPRCWWSYTLPTPGQRRRIGGVGRPSHEAYPTYELSMRFGVPVLWEIGELDRYNLPTFESQAAYLDRLALLLPGERERLKSADFEPETLKQIVRAVSWH